MLSQIIRGVEKAWLSDTKRAGFADAHTASYRKFGFTLAEVLITLGVIGIVSAMTLPSLVNKFQAKALETGFKKSYANLQNGYIMTKASLGASNLRAEYAAYDLENKTYPRAEEFKSELKKNLKVVSETTFYPFRNYSGKKTVTSDPGQDMPKAFWILPDGSSVGVHINNAKINFYVDTNGPYRKPNRYGFDIFSFAVLDSSDKIKPFKPTRKYTEEELENETWPEVAGHPCDKDSSQGANGMGCSWFAVNDISPDNESQSYWKNLPK